ncbi:UNVERIFIED_CONTAM: hypothetical protein FKN15_014015 [Acipenser sinensis]
MLPSLKSLSEPSLISTCCSSCCSTQTPSPRLQTMPSPEYPICSTCESHPFPA